MKQMSLRSMFLLLFTIAFSVGLFALCYLSFANGDDWTSFPANRHIYKNGTLVNAGDITDRDGVVLATTEEGNRIYNPDFYTRVSTLHAVGDFKGFIKTGLSTSHWDTLTGYNRVTGLFSAKSGGNNMELTLSAKVNTVALKALGNYSGAVGVYNYKTGEVLCMVSSPTYDPTKEGKEDEGIYINRFLSSSYPPGSTFKLVTAIAALETLDDAETRTYICDHGTTVEGETISCMSKHGEMTLREALAKSCNAYFSQLAIDLGAETLQKYADKLGLNSAAEIDGTKAKQGRIDLSNIRKVDLGWAGMGQYTDLVNPLGYLTVMGAIANEGRAVKPYLIESVTTADGVKIGSSSIDYTSQLFSKSTANKLKEMMRYTVSSTYGDHRFPGLNICAKTGTAEVDEGVTPHSWFVGFNMNDDYPLAFVVVAENAGAGVGVARTVANKTLQAAKELF
ncbi:MAG: penicillin-binding protein [Clostridia bacterium]|nr:penicillin-binding protein [Clostridia bacterium]